MVFVVAFQCIKTRKMVQKTQAIVKTTIQCPFIQIANLPLEHKPPYFQHLIHFMVKKFLFVLEAWNLVPNSIFAKKIQIWYQLNSQMNCQASAKAQTSLLSASYHIWSKYSNYGQAFFQALFYNWKMVVKTQNWIEL